jgi:hypothetical protein
MNAEDGKTNPPVDSGAPSALPGSGARKAYSPPRLRSLGRVSEMTLVGGSGEGRHKPPQG